MDAEWLRAPGAPQRVDYLVRSADGPRVLGPLAATRGVQQTEYHQLDVYEHTLLVLVYLEELLANKDPVQCFLDPAAFDQRVRRRLAEQGFHFPPGCGPVPEPLDPTMIGDLIL